MKLVDANIILRYLLDDVKDLANKAALIIENEELFIPIEIIAEVVYVLEKVYKVDRNDILTSLNELTNYSNINIHEREIIRTALKYYATLKLDFVDCILLAYHVIKKIRVETFDDKLRKQLEKIL